MRFPIKKRKVTWLSPSHISLHIPKGDVVFLILCLHQNLKILEGLPWRAELETKARVCKRFMLQCYLLKTIIIYCLCLEFLVILVLIGSLVCIHIFSRFSFKVKSFQNCVLEHSVYIFIT